MPVGRWGCSVRVAPHGEQFASAVRVDRVGSVVPDARPGEIRRASKRRSSTSLHQRHDVRTHPKRRKPHLEIGEGSGDRPWRPGAVRRCYPVRSGQPPEQRGISDR